MTEQEDKDKEEIRYKKFSVKKSEKPDTQNDEITYKKFKGASGNVNRNNEEITYKRFQGGSGNISPTTLTRTTQNSQPANVLNPRGFIGSCSAPNSLSQAEKNEIMNICKMTKFYDDSQYSEISKNPAFQQLKKTKPFDNDSRIGIKKPEALSSNRDITDREGLTDTDKSKLYPAMLDFLKDKKKRFALTQMQELVFNDFAIIVIFSDAGVKRTDKREEEADKIFKTLFFALYKAENKEDLITNLRASFLDMNRNDIDELIEKIRRELEEFTGEDLFKNWVVKQDREIKQEVEKEEFKEKKKEEEIKEPTVLVSNDKSKEKDKEGDRISILKQKVQNLDWDKTIDWNVIKRGLNIQPINIELDPCDDCHPDSNPLYMHKVWLERLYYELDLSDQEIAEICGMTRRPIGNWRKRLNIDTKEEKGYVIDADGYKILLMPPDYKHPQRKPTKSGRQKIAEHRIVMENFLKQNPDSEASKKYLIDGKYLKSGTEVHHINQDRLDNRIENLELYPTKKAHNLSLESLNQCLSGLIKLKQITFSNGEYRFDSSFDYRNRYNKREIQEITKPVEFRIPFENIDEIKEEIKNWEWNRISQNWTVNKHREGLIKLNPFKDYHPDSNPLYMHKVWMENILNDTRFNLTDPRLSDLCGITIHKTYYWRWEVHRISTKGRMGAPKILSYDGYIWIKIPDDYKNPFAKEYRSQKILKEYRYIAERSLANSNSPLKSEYLLDGKYLIRACKVHHINLDKLDNRIENLFITKDHRKVHNSLRSLVKQLLNSGFLNFNNGKYFLI